MLALTDLTSVFANNTIVLYTTTFLFAFYLTWVLFIRHHIHSHDRKKQAVRKYNYDKIKMATENNTEPFQRDRHVAYFKRCLTMLPQPYASNETSRMTLAFFCISALDLLGALDTITEDERKSAIEWVYAQQIHPDEKNSEESIKFCGFRGGPFMGAPYNPNAKTTPKRPYDYSNLAMTYTALAILVILGDDLSRVNKKAIIQSLKHLQTKSGSFVPYYGGLECDMRFLFCACAISYILNDFSGINIPRATDYIRSCTTYESGMGQAPGQEAHGGSTFCAVASLYLMNQADQFQRRDGTIEWCLARQVDGFQGRVSKPVDTCYSFWIGGSLALFNAYEFVDKDANIKYLLSAQTKYGGFAKYPTYHPDLMHAYMGLAGLALSGQEGVGSLFAGLNISNRAFEFLKKKTVWWNRQ